MLKECLRILKPGGRIRISTPNLKVYLDLFKENKDEMQRRYITWIANNWLERGGISLKNEAFIINLIMRGWGHNFVYDFETLKDTLLGSGFRNVLKCTVGESQEECFRDIERHGDTIKDIKGIKKQHGRLIDNEMVRFDTLVVEAIK
jgi:predicted SAM-dependent methyltransferase